MNRFGQPVSGATITVCTAGATGTPCSPLANLYSNVTLTTTQANPFTTDGLGNYSFYAAPGRYQIQFSGAGLTTTTIPDVILPCDPTNCSASSISVTNGISAFSLSLSGNLAVSGTVTTGSLNPTSISTTQTGAAPAQVGPQWYPGTATGLVTPPAQAPSVFVDATVTGSIGTTTYYYEIVYRNLNGKTSPSPVTTFAAPSGATNAIDIRPAPTDYSWRSGAFEYESCVSNDNVNFYLQTPYTNATHTTAHYVPGDAIYQSFTFSGTKCPTTNTAVIDPIQVALNATCNYSANSCSGALVVPVNLPNLTTPLIVSNQQKLVGVANIRVDQAQSLINSTFADTSIATVMAMGTANGWTLEGVAIQGQSGHGMMLMGAGQGFQNMNMAIRNSSITTRSNSGTYGALVIQGTYYNLDVDNVYLRGDKASVLVQYACGGFWKFKGSRWDDNVSAMVSTTGFTDRDRNMNYGGFPNAVGNVVLEQLFTESGTGIVFDAVNIGLKLVRVLTSDVASAPGTAAAIRMGCDSFCNGGNFGQANVIRDSYLTSSANYSTMIKVTASAGNSFLGIIIENSNIGQGAGSAAIDMSSLNFPIIPIGLTDLIPDPLAVAGHGGLIINRPAGYDSGYALLTRGRQDGSGNPIYYTELGDCTVIRLSALRARRRTLCLDPIGAQNFQILASDDTSVDANDDPSGNWTWRGTMTWNGGNKISRVLQAQTALTFGAVAAQTCGSQTVTLTGAATSNGAFASPNYAVEAGLAWSAFVSAGNTVTVRACNVTSASITPAASSNWRVWVVQE